MRSFIPALVLLATSLGFVNSIPTILPRHASCSVTKAKIPLPTGQTNLTAPTNAKPIYIAAGIGTQNYSCNAAGKFTSIGAVAELYDASCIFKKIEQMSSIDSVKFEVCRDTVLGQHYFVPNPTTGTGISPKFDFTSDSLKNDPNAFVVLSKTGDLPSPDSTGDVDWLELTAMPGQGDLAQNVFRINTIDGQPPQSCTPGSAAITVPYAALYWFFK